MVHTRPMKTSSLMVAVLTTLGAASVAFASDWPAGLFRGDQPSKTVVVVYKPFTAGRLSPALDVRQRARGFCWIQSSAAYRRADAWRCFRGKDRIADPCFAPLTPRPSYVVCPRDSWNNGVLRIDLTRPLRRTATRGRIDTVWAIVAAPNLHCVRNTGQIELIRNKPVLYGCRKSGSLLGEPDTSKRVWTIYFSPATRPGDLRRVSITKAWR
jgi:hypothetical protein